MGAMSLYYQPCHRKTNTRTLCRQGVRGVHTATAGGRPPGAAGGRPSHLADPVPVPAERRRRDGPPGRRQGEQARPQEDHHPAEPAEGRYTDGAAHGEGTQKQRLMPPINCLDVASFVITIAYYS